MSDVESDSSEDVQDLPEPKTIPSTGIFVLDHPVALVPAQQYWKIQEKLAKLTEENATLKRKLALANAGGSAGPGGGAAGSTNGAAGAAPAQRGRRSSSDHRQAKRRREESGERKNPSPEKPPPREMGEFQRREPSEMGDDPPMEMTAIQVVEYFGEIYNRKVASNVPLERKAALVQSKMTELNQLLGSSLAVSMLVPGKEDGGAAEERSVIPNQDFFRTRYGCVFKESGVDLRVQTFKRFFFDTPPTQPDDPETLVLDLERHHHLISAKQGCHPDGREGLTKPRTQNLLALYLCRKNKIRRMWICPDQNGVGANEKLSKDKVLEDTQVKLMLGWVRRFWPMHKMVYQQYHRIEVVG